MNDKTIPNLIAALNNPKLAEDWQSMAEAYSEEIAQSALQWVRRRRDDFIRAIQEINDEEDFNLLLAIQFIELKSHWMMLNTKMNYEIFRGKDPEEETVLRGSLISFLIEAIESFIDEEDLSKITEFLAQPVRRS
jgi:hypothetical protein